MTASGASQALALADAIWSSSQAIKPSVLGNSTAVREEEERGWNSQFRFTSNQKWNNPRYIINPRSHVKFHLFSLNDFFFFFTSYIFQRLQDLRLSNIFPRESAESLGTGDVGSRLAFDTSQLCDKEGVTFLLWPPASVSISSRHGKIPMVSGASNDKQLVPWTWGERLGFSPPRLGLAWQQD